MGYVVLYNEFLIDAGASVDVPKEVNVRKQFDWGPSMLGPMLIVLIDVGASVNVVQEYNYNEFLLNAGAIVDVPQRGE